eukprot:7580420-Lingulodinium_polyedra.AAC.1
MRERRQSLESDPAPGWDDRRDESTAEVAGKWAPVARRAVAEGRADRAMAAFEAAADEWLWQ